LRQLSPQEKKNFNYHSDMTCYGLYPVIDSSLKKYETALNPDNEEGFKEKLLRLGEGSLLDIGFSIEMFKELKQLLPQVKMTGMSAYVSKKERDYSLKSGIEMIGGNFLLLEDLVTGPFDVIVSKSTLDKVDKSTDKIRILQDIWNLLKFDEDPAKTGVAYLHIFNINIYRENNPDLGISNKKASDFFQSFGYDIREHKNSNYIITMHKNQQGHLVVPTN